MDAIPPVAIFFGLLFILGVFMFRHMSRADTQKQEKTTSLQRPTQAIPPPAPPQTLRPGSLQEHPLYGYHLSQEELMRLLTGRRNDSIEDALLTSFRMHPEAIVVLYGIAAADGAVTREEFRIIFRFASRMGVKDLQPALDAIADKKHRLEIDRLQDLVNIEIPPVDIVLKTLSKYPQNYKIHVAAFGEALCASNTSIAPAKARVLQALYEMAVTPDNR